MNLIELKGVICSIVIYCRQPTTLPGTGLQLLLTKDSLIMSIRPSVASGFIPEHEFGDACQELCGLALKSGQSESHLEYRQEVR